MLVLLLVYQFRYLIMRNRAIASYYLYAYISLQPMPYVTGFWKPTKMSHLANCTFLVQLIAIFIHYPCTVAIPGLAAWSVCISRVDFAEHVKSRLRQWDPWRALDGRYGSDIHPCVSETSLSRSRLVYRPMTSTVLGLIYSYSKQSSWKV